LIINETEQTEHVSRSHARLTVNEHQEVFIEDLNSTSGTYVNGIRINHITKVNPHSVITLGKSYQFNLSHPTIQNEVMSMSSSLTYRADDYDQDEFEYANWGSRLGAYLLDGIFINIIYFVFGFMFGAAMGPQSQSTVGLISLLISLVVWHFYYVVPLHSGGSTFGKRVCGVKVLSYASGHYPSTGQAWGRSIGYALSAIILWIGFLMPLWTEKKQALHDMLAGTIVVKA
jgi:uncharacterized RDD family membrane protein YckC